MRKLGTTDLEVSRLCLGGNVFGWTVAPGDAFAVLDTFSDAGGNFIDTADSYTFWAAGTSGGESETVIGEWTSARGNRDQVVIATKVGERPDHRGLAPATIKSAVEGSLTRLQTDSIDLLYAHFDDTSVPLEETLAAFDELVVAGKVRHIGASKHSAGRLREALEIQEREGFAPYRALSHQYNLMRRDVYEGETEQFCTDRQIAFLPFYGLASGFLTGKYRDDPAADEGVRAPYVEAYRNARGEAVLAVVDEIAARHRVRPAAVALAWLAGKPTVAAPIASARTPAQVDDLAAVLTLELDPTEMRALDEVSVAPAE
jgi:aryl-alcohol dehydrogenase-like predicted oxidoreductase